ncbi:MAG: uracil-DNA glycosylase [Candidatus Cloacimonetes bacterium]|nr:uracil-DNA glycosylase [Candidatus Cloacimonadota bacterium]
MVRKELEQYLEFLEISGIQDIYFSKKASAEKVITAKPSAFVSNTKGQKLEALQNAYKDCQKCELWRGRNKFVYGNGNPDAKLMLIGEGPGAEENATGQVFVGRAGQLLTKMLHAIHLRRDEVYITNIVKCRPPNNRDPLPQERAACMPYLLEQLAIIQPELLLLMGKVAANTILESRDTLTKMRQHTHLFQGIKTYVTYHPSALLRNEHWKRPAWEDLQMLQRDYEALT